MRSFEKKYIVPEQCGLAMARSIARYIGSFNRRKMGRNRRGMVKLSCANGKEIGDGKYQITLTFRTGESAFFKIAGVGRFQRHSFVDFRKPLRILASANSKQ